MCVCVCVWFALLKPQVMHLESNIPELSEVVAVFSQAAYRFERGFQGLGFRGLGFRGLGFRVQGLGFRSQAWF